MPEPIKSPPSLNDFLKKVVINGTMNHALVTEYSTWLYSNNDTTAISRAISLWTAGWATKSIKKTAKIKDWLFRAPNSKAWVSIDTAFINLVVKKTAKAISKRK